MLEKSIINEESSDDKENANFSGSDSESNVRVDTNNEMQMFSASEFSIAESMRGIRDGEG